MEEVDLVEPAVLQVRADNQRLDELEAEVERLRQGFDELSRQFSEFRKQFE